MATIVAIMISEIQPMFGEQGTIYSMKGDIISKQSIQLTAFGPDGIEKGDGPLRIKDDQRHTGLSGFWQGPDRGIVRGTSE